MNARPLLLPVLLGLTVATPLSLAPPPASALEVILMRHADKDSERGDYNLSPVGFRRAVELARLIPACFGPANEILTFFLNPITAKNSRSYQSAVPLAVATGTNIRISQQSLDHSLAIGRRLRRRGGQAGTRVVLFWEHRRMPELARGLGWSGMDPIANDDFDQIFVFRYAGAGASPEVRRYRQSALLQQPCFHTSRLPWDSSHSAPAVPTNR